jgi:hypothetical protein
MNTSSDNTNSSFWHDSGFTACHRNARGWLVPAPTYWLLYLARPELALVSESCAAEIALHDQLVADPIASISAAQIDAMEDDSVRDNYRMFLAFRDAVLAAGSIEAYYLALMRGGAVSIPPLFVDLLVYAIAHNMLDGCDTTQHGAWVARAAELLWRPQRVALEGGRLLCADRDVIDARNDTAGLGDIGRLLIQNKAAVKAAPMPVLSPETQRDYWAHSARHELLLDLTHALTQELGHGLSFNLTRTHSGLKALATVLEIWVAHLLGLAVQIKPEQKIDDPAWRWHLGLDAESTALLNNLYEDRPVEDARLRRLVSLFRLEFKDLDAMRADVAGKPVYLGLTMDAGQVIRLKPQNLLLNLPLRRISLGTVLA